MSGTLSRATAHSEPPRHLRVLATSWLPAAVLLGLTALGAAGTAVQSLVVLLTDDVRPWGPASAVLLVSVVAALVLGRITWRLAVEVPRTLRAWDAALAERRAAQRR